MFHLYVLRSELTGRLYIGSTSLLKRQIDEHNAGLAGLRWVASFGNASSSSGSMCRAGAKEGKVAELIKGTASRNLILIPLGADPSSEFARSPIGHEA